MNNPSFIDQLSSIQTAVRNGAKWEYRGHSDGAWNTPSDQSVEYLNLRAQFNEVRLAPKPAETVEDER